MILRFNNDTFESDDELSTLTDRNELICLMVDFNINLVPEKPHSNIWKY